MAVWYITIQEKQEKQSAAICASALISYLSTMPLPPAPCPNHTASKLHSLQISAKNKFWYKHSFLFNKIGRDKLDLLLVSILFVTIQEFGGLFSVCSKRLGVQNELMNEEEKAARMGQALQK